MRPEKTIQLLRWTLGVTAFVAGADKFTNLLTDWEKYLAPQVERDLPIEGRTFMRLVGIIEMVVGALVLGGHGKLGAYIASAWLTAIAGNLILSGEYLDVAVRDVNMAIGALAVAALTGARSQKLDEIQPLENAA